MKTRNLKLATLSVACLAVVVALGFLAGNPAHALGFDWHAAATGGLMLANAPLAIAEQIKLFETKRETAEAGATELITKSIDEGRTLDDQESEKHAEYEAEIDAIDKHLAILRKHETMQVSKARPVPRDAGRDGTGADIDARPNAHITVKSNLPKGIRFTRFSMAMAQSKGNVMQAAEIAKARYKDTPEVAVALQASVALGGTKALKEAAVEHQKAAVAFGTTTDSAFVGPLVQYTDMESEFVELLRPKMVLGRMQSLNRIPFMSRMGRQLTGVTGSFVGEGQPKPVGKQTYDNVTLGFAKVAVIVVLSDEAVRFSSPNAEIKARDDMIKGIATYIDKRFMDPSYSGVANVSPASITNAATRIQSSGSTLAAIDADVRTAMAMFATSEIDPSTAVWVMPAAVALRLSMKRTSQDEKAFPELTMLGGTWYGIPVIVSNSMVASGSPAELQIALVTQEEVFLADDGGVSIDMSQEASVQMNDAPSAGAQSLVSLWQNNLVGIRAEQYINWAPRRTGNLGIAVIENTNY